MPKVRKLRDLDFDQFSNKGAGRNSMGERGEDPRIFRKRQPKSCYCGGHSIGKETLNREKNRRLLNRRMKKRYKYLNI